MQPNCLDFPKSFKIASEPSKVNLINVGQTFGEEDVIHQGNKYTASVKCISNTGKAYIMKEADFINTFKDNKDSWRMICQLVDGKIQNKIPLK
mgnify:CR=1 FL=1